MSRALKLQDICRDFKALFRSEVVTNLVPASAVGITGVLVLAACASTPQAGRTAPAITVDAPPSGARQRTETSRGNYETWGTLAEERQNQVLCELAPDCCAYDGVDGQREVERARLDQNTTLLLMECSTFGFNRESTAWTVRKGQAPIPARFDPLPSDVDLDESPIAPSAEGHTWLTSPWYEAGLHTMFCIRGRCDAGTHAEFEWTGQTFRLRRLRSRDDDCCSELDDTGPWPIVWPASEVCDFRWRMKSGVPILVTITPNGAAETRIDGLPPPCIVSDDGRRLSCNESDVPVTSDGSHWLVWLRSGSKLDPGASSIRHRVPQGCALTSEQ